MCTIACKEGVISVYCSILINHTRPQIDNLIHFVMPIYQISMPSLAPSSHWILVFSYWILTGHRLDWVTDSLNHAKYIFKRNGRRLESRFWNLENWIPLGRISGNMFESEEGCVWRSALSSFCIRYFCWEFRWSKMIKNCCKLVISSLKFTLNVKQDI